MKASHALELVETQGVGAFRAFLERQGSERPSPAQRAFLGDEEVVQAREMLRGMTLEHPKVETAIAIVTAQLTASPDSRVIVFAQYRQTAELLEQEFARLGGGVVRAARFVGQASRDGIDGMSQKEQTGLLDRFRAGEVNCLIATSVAEEGLDVPSTDLVVLYEPVPDVIRSIQRRGRTGRARPGRAVVLVAQGTRDVGLQRGAKGKERRMHEMLERLEEEVRRGAVGRPAARAVQHSLEEYPGRS
jgi:Fanconi anemia group M protein